MNKCFVARELIRIANMICGDKEVDPALYNLKSVSAITHYIDNIVKPYTKGFKNDNWGAIYQIVDAIRYLGVDVECTKIDDSKYRVDGGFKRYNLAISFVNVAGKRAEISYQIIASACGTIKDPWSLYDIVAYSTQGRLVKA